MKIVLLKNGKGVIRGDTLRLATEKLNITFVGAQPGSIVRVVTEYRTIRRRLSSSSSCELDISDILGEVRFTVISDNMVWSCDGIHVVKDASDNVAITVLHDYPAKLEKLFTELINLSEEFASLKEEFTQLKSALESKNINYKII